MGQEGLDLELKPLTIFVGPNGSGKSTTLEALAFIAQGFRLGEVTMPPRFSDPNNPLLLSYPSMEWFRHKRQPRSNPVLELYLNLDQNDRELLLRNAYASSRIPGPPMALGYWLHFKEDGNFSHGYDITGVRLECLGFPPSVFVEEERPGQFGQRGGSSEPTSLLKKKLRNVFLITTLRGSFEKKTLLGEYSSRRELDPQWVGSTGEYTLHILSKMTNIAYRQQIAKVKEWTERFGLVDLTSGWRKVAELDSEYLDDKFGSPLELDASGFGARQILPIITQLFWSPEGSVIMVEEPEISLHLALQLELPLLFADAISQGRQVIATSQSELMLLGLRKAVRQGNLHRDQIAVYEFEKTSTGVRAHALKVSTDGRVEGWIPGFIKVEDELFEEWIKGLPEEQT